MLTELMNVVTFECRQLGLRMKLNISWVVGTPTKPPPTMFPSEKIIICRKPKGFPLSPSFCIWMNFKLHIR